MKAIFAQFRPALAATMVLAFVTGGIYPALVYGLAHGLFRAKAGGSLIVDGHGTIRGSKLVGQNFSGEEYFHPRPSAAGANGYDAANSGGSNLGPTSLKLREAIADRIIAYRKENGLSDSDEVPADAVTGSGSGLDPHITPRNAGLQMARVAKARGLSAEKVRALIAAHTDPASFGFLGAPGVNVLTLNLALDEK
jgi:K+-transporting ATPase ATPase C chain